MRHLPTSTLLLLSLVLVGRSAGGDWPRFRGPDGSAASEDDKVPTEWGDKKNLKWKLSLPGRGFSSPIVVGDRVFVTCYSGGDGDLSSLKRYLVCADRNKGGLLWSKTVPAVLPEFRSRGGFGYHGYASSTPVSDGAAIAAAWPGARLRVTTGLGHRRMLSDPAVVAEAIAFLTD